MHNHYYYESQLELDGYYSTKLNLNIVVVVWVYCGAHSALQFALMSFVRIQPLNAEGKYMLDRELFCFDQNWQNT
jgi:hypothetical protein